MNKREALRKYRIEKLRQILLATLKKKRNPNYEKLVMYCQTEWEISRRTARDYIDTLKSFCKKEGIKIDE